MTVIKDFSEWMKGELDARGWKPTELARRAELDDGIISRALSGARMPSNRSLEKIAEALDVSVDEVYRAAGHLPPITEQEEWAAKIYRRLERMPPEVREIAELFIDALYQKEMEKATKKQRNKKSQV